MFIIPSPLVTPAENFSSLLVWFTKPNFLLVSDSFHPFDKGNYSFALDKASKRAFSN